MTASAAKTSRKSRKTVSASDRQRAAAHKAWETIRANRAAAEKKAKAALAKRRATLAAKAAAKAA